MFAGESCLPSGDSIYNKLLERAHFSLERLRTQPDFERVKHVMEHCTILNDILHHLKLTDDELLIFAFSRELFPNDPHVLDAYAQFLFKTNHRFQALEIASLALANTEHCSLERSLYMCNMENIKTNVMNQWHWAMMNDRIRNCAYESAIRTSLMQLKESNSGCELRVLDIGGGSGILSIYASRNASSVYCCEVDENMCDIAERVCTCFHTRIIQKHSTELEPSDLDFQKVHLVVTETMDCAAFGESIISTLLDVQKKFLLPGGIIIPRKLDLCVCMIESLAIEQEHVAILGSKHVVSNYVHFDDKNRGEPYWCCYMTEVKGGYHRISTIKTAFSVALNDICQLEEVTSGISHDVKLEAEFDERFVRRASAIMAWFRCELAPGIEFSTHPQAGTNWQQTVFPLCKPCSVTPGSVFHLKIRFQRDRLDIRLVDISNNESQAFRSNGSNEFLPLSEPTINLESDWEMMDYVEPRLEALQLMNSDEPACEAFSYRHDPTVLDSDFLFLNDPLVTDFFIKSMENVSNSSSRFADITEIPSVFYALCSRSSDFKMKCFYQDCVVKNAFNQDMEGRITFIQTSSSDKPISLDDRNANVLLCWPIQSDGVLCDYSLFRISEFHTANENLLVIPSIIKVRAEVISWPTIRQRAKLDPTAYQGVDLSALEKLSISYFYDIEPSYSEIVSHSDAFDLLNLNLNERTKDVFPLPNYLSQYGVKSSVNITRDGVVHGLLFWFELMSSAAVFSVRSNESLARCAIYIFDENLQVSHGNTLNFVSSLCKGHLLFEYDGMQLDSGQRLESSGENIRLVS